MNAFVMADPSLVAGGEHTVFVSGNDAQAKAQVTEILRSFGWSDVIDLGDITTARGTEMYLPLWLRLWGALGTGDVQHLRRAVNDRGRRSDLSRHRRHVGDRKGDGSARWPRTERRPCSSPATRPRERRRPGRSREATGNDRLEVLVADLSSQASIRALVEAFRVDHDRLDVLINCAGAFFRERHVTATASR